MATLEAALALAAKGCLVFPIKPGTKKPAIRRWPDLATTDPDQIRRWWSRWPEANVGVHTRGLLVLDIDGPLGHANLLRLRERTPLPETLTILSGNRAEPQHYQLLYRLPPGMRARNKPLDQYPGYADFDRIDVKSTRGQVVGPGSLHATGGTYRWDTEPANVYEQAAEAPEWAVRAFCEVIKAQEPPDGCLAPGTSKEGRLEPGSDEELLQVLHCRYPIRASGERQDQMAGAIGWLASKGLPAERTLHLALSWLGCYREVFATPCNQAMKELYGLVHRTQRNIERGKFSLPPDHQALTAGEELLPELEAWLFRLVHGPAIQIRGTTKRAQNVLCSRRLSLSEERFLEVLLLHYQYEMRKQGGAENFLMTDRQLMAIHEKRFGQKLTWNRLYEMKDKFFTRHKENGKLRRASHREVVVLERPGINGKPSRYRAQGLPTIERPQGCGEPSPALRQ